MPPMPLIVNHVHIDKKTLTTLPLVGWRSGHQVTTATRVGNMTEVTMLPAPT